MTTAPGRRQPLSARHQRPKPRAGARSRRRGSHASRLALLPVQSAATARVLGQPAMHHRGVSPRVSNGRARRREDRRQPGRGCCRLPRGEARARDAGDSGRWSWLDPEAAGLARAPPPQRACSREPRKEGPSGRSRAARHAILSTRPAGPMSVTLRDCTKRIAAGEEDIASAEWSRCRADEVSHGLLRHHHRSADRGSFAVGAERSRVWISIKVATCSGWMAASEAMPAASHQARKSAALRA